jgi:hypothetical protein
MDMRLVALLVGTSMLAACGGGAETGINTAGTPPPAPATVVGVPNNAPANAHTFVTPTQQRTYRGNGGFHRLTTTFEAGTIGELYAGNATTVRNSGISISYNPRDAIFELMISDPLSGVSQPIRFQDPAQRTDFGGAIEPQLGVPNFTIPGIQYLQVGGPRGALQNDRLVLSDIRPGSYDATTFFYQRPGTTTRYVTFAGYVRNVINQTDTRLVEDFSRGAFVFGEQSINSDVPRTGTGTFNGTLLATSVVNDQLDNDPLNATVFQFIEGTSSVAVNFGTNAFNIALDGTFRAPTLGLRTPNTTTALGGAAFGARGSGRIDLVSTGGFLGQFQQAWFTNPGAAQQNLRIEGSSVDGAFFGPTAQEVGGSFRIVGGTPDERIDILGIFTGIRQ